jgi:hypothetical protein
MQILQQQKQQPTTATTFKAKKNIIYAGAQK